MKLNSEFIKAHRLIGKVGFFFVGGVILLIFGLIISLMNINSAEYQETTGTIISIEVEHDDIDNDITHVVTVEYEVEGKIYTAEYYNYNSSMKKGDTVNVRYNPDKPEQIGSDSKVGLILLAVGGGLLLIGVIILVTNLNKNKKLKEQEEGFKDYQQKVEMYGEDVQDPKYDEDRKYYMGLYVDEKAYKIKDEKDEVVYEIKIVKANQLTGACTCSFVDNVNVKTTEYKFGANISFNEESYKKINGVKCWDFLHEKGIRIISNLFDGGMKNSYEITRFGMEYAKASTINPAEMGVNNVGGAQFGRTPQFTMPGFYEFTTKAQNLELIVLTLFTISQTGQAFHD